jgi:hypothetical protein
MSDVKKCLWNALFFGNKWANDKKAPGWPGLITHTLG